MAILSVNATTTRAAGISPYPIQYAQLPWPYVRGRTYATEVAGARRTAYVADPYGARILAIRLKP